MAYPIAPATVQHTQPATTVTVTLPTHVAGDLIVIFLSQNVGSTAISESSAFSWTVRNPASVTGDARMAVAYKYSSGGGESNPTFTGTVTNAWSVQTVVIRDADPTTYVAGYADKTFTSNPVASPALSTVAADDDYGPILLLYGWGFDGGSIYARTYTNDLVALGKDIGNTSVTVTDITINSIVGYRVQATYGAAPSVSAYTVATTEGGNAWVLAIKNKSGGVTATDCRSGSDEFQWYGTFGVANQNPTWDAPSNFTASTIGGIATDTTLADKANTASVSSWSTFQWGAATYLEVNTTVEEWVGGSHPITSKDMTGKVFYLQWAISATSNATNCGTNGVIVGFSDGTKWVTYQLSPKSMFLANAPVSSHIALGNATEFANSEGTSTSTINWAAITRVMYAYHRASGVAGYTTLYIQNATLYSTSTITGGSSSVPATWNILKTCLEGYGNYAVINLQGKGQVLGKNNVQIGDGTTPTYFSAGAKSFEFPTTYSSTVQYTWNAKANSVSLSIYASAADTISLAAGVMATETAQAFGFNASSSSSASYPMTGATLVGFDVTLKSDIPISGATFSTGSAVNGSSTDITNVVVNKPTGSVAYSVSADGAVLDGCTIDVTNTSAAYHLELGTAVTAITLTDVTFTGTPGTDKVHVLKTTGTVTITISGTTSLAAGDVTSAGATVVISAPQLYQVVVVSGFTAGSRIQIYDTTSSTELFNGTASAGDTVVSGTTATWTDPLAASANRAIRVRISYVNGANADVFQELSGLTCGQTSGTESVTYPVTPVVDTVYEDNGVTGSTVAGITFTDAATDLVVCNIAGGTVSWAQIYAAFVYWMSTATGIADDITYVDAVDQSNYLLTSMKIKNTNATPLTITGGWGRDSTTLTIADIIDTAGSTGNIFPLPDHVVNNIVTVGGVNIITGDIADVPTAAEVATAVVSDSKTLTVGKFLGLK